MAFENRIISYGEKPADQFTANPLNPRLHPQFQREVMQAALTELGWLAPVIENKRTGYLIDGHERVMQALLNNEAAHCLPKGRYPSPLSPPHITQSTCFRAGCSAACGT